MTLDRKALYFDKFDVMTTDVLNILRGMIKSLLH